MDATETRKALRSITEASGADKIKKNVRVAHRTPDGAVDKISLHVRTGALDGLMDTKVVPGVARRLKPQAKKWLAVFEQRLGRPVKLGAPVGEAYIESAGGWLVIGQRFYADIADDFDTPSDGDVNNAAMKAGASIGYDNPR